MDQQPQAKEPVEPLFFRQADFESALEQSKLNGDTAKTPLRPYEVCTAVAKIDDSGKIKGAQNVRGTWRLYFRTRETRLNFITRKYIMLRDQLVPLYDKNPTVTRQNNPGELREKITVKDIPLSVSNVLIAEHMSEIGVILKTDVK